MKSISGNCPVCDATVALSENVEVSEIVACSECKSKLVVTSIDEHHAVLSEAPAIEEDWGE